MSTGIPEDDYIDDATGLPVGDDMDDADSRSLAWCILSDIGSIKYAL